MIRTGSALGGALILLAGASSFANASPVTINGPFQFLDNRSSNDAGITAGVLIQLGANNVTPSGASGTTGEASRNSQNGPVVRPLNPENFTVNPNFFTRGVNDVPGNRQAWTLTFTNGQDSATATTPGVPANLQQLPFASNVQIGGSGLTPTLSWTNTAANINAVAVRIRDNGVNAQISTGGFKADLISVQYFNPQTTTYTVPQGLLTAGHEYSLEIDQLQTRTAFNPNASAGATFVSTLNQSRSFFDFSASANGFQQSSVFLPTVSVQANGSPSYSFDISTHAGQTYYIDPQFASGYNFHIGSTGPNFESVLLPVLNGTSSYTIILPDGSTFVVQPGSVFDFTDLAAWVNGVAGFRVLGIDPSSAVNPFDPNAFVTGLTFVADGQFTGTMDPIYTAAVPEPSTWAMMICGLFGTGFFASRRKSKPTLMAA
ncbi:PEP-CTERM sorting domain-containing protein [Frankia sp. RB7]|nr:PEP-CTERM sorting domain-containing protein [Frankia sp. RB7]